MADREKVIDILGACGTDDCDNCPLNGNERCSGFIDVPVEVLMDAIALLKEQEARVLTLEESGRRTAMPIDDYIKRSDCIEAMTKAEKWWWNADDLRQYHEIIESLPAADVEPKRKTGKWIDENPASIMDPRMRCSVCGQVDIPLAKWRFCPMCGAKIDKEVEVIVNV